MDRIVEFIKNNLRLLIGAFVVILLVFFLTLFVASRRSSEATINGQTFKVEVAEDEKEKQIGLSEKEELSEDRGMVFLFDRPDRYSFWMKNMKFPIDIIYINGDRVTTIIHDARPGQDDIFQPDEPSDKVLEVKAGQSKKLNIQKGSKVTFKNL
jgi:uncharacterized protein